MLSDQSQRTTERRWVERYSKQLPAGLRRAGDKGKPAVLADISTDGCKIEEVLNLRTGERVWVRLPGLEGQQAQIRWSRLDTAGILFDRPLHMAVVENILSA
jgi:hypothetical protein